MRDGGDRARRGAGTRRAPLRGTVESPGGTADHWFRRGAALGGRGTRECERTLAWRVDPATPRTEDNGRLFYILRIAARF